MTIEEINVSFLNKIKKKDLKISLLDNYVNLKTKLKVQTEIGIHLVSPSSLIRGSKPSILSCINKTECIVNKFKLIHGDSYDYSKVEYFSDKSYVKIICKKHNKEFSQTVNNHIEGKGCYLCGREKTNDNTKNNPPGWSYTNWELAGLNSKNFDSFKLYIIECSNKNEKFYKIGKTFRTLSKRFSSQKADMPYKYKIIYIEIADSKTISKNEKKYHSILKKEKYIPNIFFGGSNECFKSIKLLNIKYDTSNKA